jgi:hypothetical protein
MRGTTAFAAVPEPTNKRQNWPSRAHLLPYQGNAVALQRQTPQRDIARAWELEVRGGVFAVGLYAAICRPKRHKVGGKVQWAWFQTRQVGRNQALRDYTYPNIHPTAPLDGLQTMDMESSLSSQSMDPEMKSLTLLRVGSNIIHQIALGRLGGFTRKG